MYIFTHKRMHNTHMCRARTTSTQKIFASLNDYLRICIHIYTQAHTQTHNIHIVTGRERRPWSLTRALPPRFLHHWIIPCLSNSGAKTFWSCFKTKTSFRWVSVYTHINLCKCIHEKTVFVKLWRKDVLELFQDQDFFQMGECIHKPICVCIYMRKQCLLNSGTKIC